MSNFVPKKLGEKSILQKKRDEEANKDIKEGCDDYKKGQITKGTSKIIKAYLKKSLTLILQNINFIGEFYVIF